MAKAAKEDVLPQIFLDKPPTEKLVLELLSNTATDRAWCCRGVSYPCVVWFRQGANEAVGSGGTPAGDMMATRRT